MTKSVKNTRETVVKKAEKEIGVLNEDDINPLKEAMRAAGSSTSTFDAVAELDLDLDIDIEEDIKKKIEEELMIDSDERPTAVADGVKKDRDVSDYLNKESERILEFRNKQRATKDMVSEIYAGSDLLTNIAKQAEFLVAYLEKAETEFSRLEQCEVDADKLTEQSSILVKKAKEDTAIIIEQKKRISLLEQQNTDVYEQLERSKIELARMEGKAETQAFEIEEQKALAARWKCEKQVLEDRGTIVDSERQRAYEEALKIQENLDLTQESKKDTEKQLTKVESALSDLHNRNDQLVSEIDDLQSRFETLQDRHLEQTADLKKKIQEMTSTRNELDEKLHVSRQRCADLEAKVTALEKRTISDLESNKDVVSSLMYELENAKPNGARAKQVPA